MRIIAISFSIKYSFKRWNMSKLKLDCMRLLFHMIHMNVLMVHYCYIVHLVWASPVSLQSNGCPWVSMQISSAVMRLFRHVIGGAGVMQLSFLISLQ